MYEFRDLHQPGCPHAGTGDGWTVFEEKNRPLGLSDADHNGAIEQIRQTLACLSCGAGYVRTLAVEGARYTSAADLALGWPSERAAGCELAVIRVASWGQAEPEAWQVRRDGYALGIVVVERGRRGGRHFAAGTYPPNTAPFHPEFVNFGDRPCLTGAQQQFSSRTAAVRWVRDHAPRPAGSGDSPAGTR
ncbi:MAG: hypothetical protein ACJ73S_13120 [Mycobacteriales bacterium]